MRYFDSLTKADVPADITPEAESPVCPKHPDGGYSQGFGYAGGGFGSYNICNACDAVFAKKAALDGNNGK